MIYFCANDGSIKASIPENVNQGSAGSNNIYLVAPFSANMTVGVGFVLPNGQAVAPVMMSQPVLITGEDGQQWAAFSYTLPNNITQYYGKVLVQFFFYGTKQVTAGGVTTDVSFTTATTSTYFMVNRGVFPVLPEAPSETVYEQILSNLSTIQNDLQNGVYVARAVFPWQSTTTYGANEIVFVPGEGEYGAIVRSLQANNLNQAPYTEGVLNATWWAEVVNFNTITEDFFGEIKEQLTAAQAAQAAAEAAQSAAETAQQGAETAQGQAELAVTNAEAAQSAAETAQAGAEQAQEQAELAVTKAEQAQTSAETAQDGAETAQGQSELAAQQAAQSAAQAAQSAQEAKDYAKREYQVYPTYDDLPRPGESAYIYLVPAATPTEKNTYEEYIWVTNANDYEFLGTTNEIDLSNYAQINGSYAGMSVGYATNAGAAESATKATQDGQGNNIVVTYATKSALESGLAGKQPTGNYALQDGTYADMTVGNAVMAESAGTAGNADNADELGGVPAADYSLKAGEFIPGTITKISSVSGIVGSPYAGENVHAGAIFLACGVDASAEFDDTYSPRFGDIYQIAEVTGEYVTFSSRLGNISNGSGRILPVSYIGASGGAYYQSITNSPAPNNVGDVVLVVLGTGTGWGSTVKLGDIRVVTSVSTQNQYDFQADTRIGNIFGSSQGRYKVGTYVLQDTDTPPDGGEWEVIYNRVLIGAGDTYPAGSTGGASQVTLTVDQLPAHQHQVIDGDTNVPIGLGFGAGVPGIELTGWQNVGNIGKLTYTSNTGNGQPFSVLPPYLAIYILHKTA